MIGVCASIGAYRIAAAELPLSTRLTAEVADAIVVIGGDRRWERSAHAAFDDGAAAVIVSDPSAVDDDECRRLEEVADGRPIIVDRPLLRTDLARTASVAGTPPHYVAVDLAVASARRALVIREAAGWMRVLVGGRYDVQRVDSTAFSRLALVQREDTTVTGVLTATTIDGADEGAWIRAVSVAETRVEVVIDEAGARKSVEIATADGVRRAAPNFEANERLTLRRALDAVATVQTATDLAELRSDAAVAGVIDAGGR